MCILDNVFISLIVGAFGCFQSFSTINDTAVNIFACQVFCRSDSFRLDSQIEINQMDEWTFGYY